MLETGKLAPFNRLPMTEAKQAKEAAAQLNLGMFCRAPEGMYFSLLTDLL